MDDILIIENFSQYNALRGYETLHPLANVVDLSKSKPIQNARVHIDTYSVFLKEAVCGDLKYGCNYYDYQEGTLVFMAPGQVIGINNDVANSKILCRSASSFSKLFRGSDQKRDGEICTGAYPVKTN